jgi:hypothetical protein
LPENSERLNPKYHGAISEAVQIFDLGEGYFQFSERAGVKQEDHLDKVSVGVIGIDGRVGAGNSNLVFGEDGGNFGNHAGAIGDGKTHVIGSSGVVDCD